MLCRSARLNKGHCARMNVIHGACQPNIALVGHAPQDRAALTDPLKGQVHGLVEDLEKCIDINEPQECFALVASDS